MSNQISNAELAQRAADRAASMATYADMTGNNDAMDVYIADMNDAQELADRFASEEGSAQAVVGVLLGVIGLWVIFLLANVIYPALQQIAQTPFIK